LTNQGLAGAGLAGQRDEQIHRRLGVICAAAPRHLGRLDLQRRIGVQLKQLSLQPGHFLGAGDRAAL
jgi:hypothetical protein